MRISILIIGIATNCILYAQKNTYFQVHWGSSSTGFKIQDYSPQIYNSCYVGGHLYDFHLRQELVSIMSIEFGYSNRSYYQAFGLKKNYLYSTEQFITNQFPISINLDINVYKDVSLYSSYGYMFCIERSISDGNIISLPNEEYLAIDWKYIPGSKYNSKFLVNLGARIRIIDELLFEIECGRAFRTKDFRIYSFTFKDNSGLFKTLSTNDLGNYWYFQFGLSYPIQRTGKILGGLFSKLI
jgi:hypothetical protein